VRFSLLIEFRIMPGVEWQAAAAAVGEHNNECLHRDCFHVKEYGGGTAAAAAMQQVWESGGGGGERGKVCILSIDGGGGMLRGIIPARVLAYLEELLKRKSGNSEARIADYFDVVAGTSVGGILATMLCACDANSRPLFTAEETWKLIAEKGRSVFFNQLLPTSRMWSRLRGLMRPRFSSKRLEALLKQYLIRDGRPLTLRDTMKPVLIPCYDLATAGPFLFSRADALENQTWNFNLWEVCRATTAVPSLFKPAYMTSVDGNTSCTAVDGGVVMHNPTAAAVTHVLHNKLEFPRVQGVNDLLVLSLGTGQMDQPYAYNTVRGWGAFQWVKPIANIVLDSISDMVDHTISMSFGDFRQQYFRIQV
jgi:patatin-like phospholipase/acyl hydrolase